MPPPPLLLLVLQLLQGLLMLLLEHPRERARSFHGCTHLDVLEMGEGGESRLGG